MYLTFIGKELFRNVLSLRYALVFAMVLGLVTGATVIRTHHYRKQVEDYGNARRDRLAAMMDAKRHWQSEGLGVTVEKEPNPLAIFAFGLENEATRSFSLSTWDVPRTGERKLSNPSFRYFPNLDLVLIVNVVCSLLAMLLVFDAVCGEREQGTLKVLLAGPLPRDVVIVSKLVAGLLTVLVPFVAAWVASLAYVVLVGKVSLGPEQFARLMWIGSLSVLYIVFFFGLGIAVSSWTHRSATALAACLFCWIVFVLALPNLVPMVVDRFSPIPPESKITLQKATAYRRWEKERQPKVYAELSAKGGYKDIYELWQDLQKIRREELGKETSKVDRFYNSRISRQLRLNQDFSRLSPSASLVYASTHLAGTGVRDFLRLIDDVDAFARDYDEVRNTLDEERREEWKDKDVKWFEERIDAFDPTRYPAFKPATVGLSTVLNWCWLDVVMLCGGTAVLLLLSVVGFMRYDPR